MMGKNDKIIRLFFCAFSLSIYMIFVLYITVLSRETGHSVFAVNCFRCISSFFFLGVNTIKAIYTLLQNGIWPGIYYSDYYYAMIKEGIENVILFVPIGVLVSWLAFEKKKISNVILYCLVLSLLIEVLQLFTGRGTFDIDDLLNNSFGGWLGRQIAIQIGEDNKMSFKLCIKNILNSKGVLIVRNFLNPKNRIRIPGTNVFICTKTTLNGIDVYVRGKNNIIIIEQMSTINNCKIRIYGSNNVILIKENCLINNSSFWVEDDGGEIVLGKGTTINGSADLSVIEGTKIMVGEDCMFSTNISFMTGDAHSIVDANGKRINYSESIIVGNHVWIGADVVILKGASIPNNTIVGRKGLVNKKFSECGTIIAGVPAKVVRYNINWLRERV